MVKQCLIISSHETWLSKIAQHQAQVPYDRFQPQQSDVVLSLAQVSLTMDVLTGIRAWCRLRAGLVRLRHRDGKRSRSKFQSCLFCTQVVRNATVHMVASCPMWKSHREQFESIAGGSKEVRDGEKTLLFLGVSTTSPAFVVAARWADAVEQEAACVWRGFDSASNRIVL
jgi:hypothetical protein